jgi:signal peptidase I
MNKTVRGIREFVHEWTLNILILVFGTTTLLQAFIVPTPSMDATVMVGDHLIVDKLAYSPSGPISRFLLPYTEPKRGDIIVFRYPLDIRQNYVKRVIGVPGDHIKIVDKQLYLNGKAMGVEPYAQHVFPGLERYRDNFPMPPEEAVNHIAATRVDPARALEMLKHQENGELVVPPDSYFAMGDNRDNSLDSRYWGFVPRDYIVGKPLLIFWSYDAPTNDWVGDGNHYTDLMQNFFTKTRWKRTLKLVRGVDIK